MNMDEQEVFLKIKKLIKEHTDLNTLKEIRKEYPTIFDKALLDCMNETSNELKNKK